MGANYKGQDKGIEELKGLSEDAKKYLSHHLRNSLSVIKGNAEISRSHMVKRLHLYDDQLIERLSAIIKHSNHIIEDLEKIGC